MLSVVRSAIYEALVNRAGNAEVILHVFRPSNDKGKF